MSNKIIIPPIEVQNIIDDYVNQRMSILQLHKKYNYSEGVIKRHLSENNISIRGLSESHQLYFEHNYFDKIDTKEKAYWLGFIYADGCISISRNNMFEIKLAIKDIELLETFKRDIKSEHQIGIYTSNNGYNKGLQYCRFGIDSKDLCEQLIKLGVNTHKTKNCIFPDIDILPRQFIWDFIRGYFDGDGSVYVSNDKYKDSLYQSPSVAFTGTQEILESILLEVKKHCKTETVVHPYYDDKAAFDLKFGGVNIVNTIYHLMYDDATRWLERKKSIFEQFLIDDKIETLILKI